MTKFAYLFSRKQQIQRLSSYAADISVVAIGSIVIPFILGNFDALKVIVGILFAILFLVISLLLERKTK